MNTLNIIILILIMVIFAIEIVVKIITYRELKKIDGMSDSIIIIKKVNSTKNIFQRKNGDE